jgi:hypothetical protein
LCSSIRRRRLLGNRYEHAVGVKANRLGPLGALTAAGQKHSLAPTGSKHVVVAIYNGSGMPGRTC